MHLTEKDRVRFRLFCELQDTCRRFGFLSEDFEQTQFDSDITKYQL